MHDGLDLFATLHHLVRRAMERLPGSQRGSLIVWEGQRLVYRAAVGFDGDASSGLRAGADAGGLCASPPFGPEAAPEAARAMCVVPAAAWYRAHHPGAAGPRGPRDDGLFVLVAPVLVHGEASGYLALEQPTAALPEGDRRDLIELLAQGAGGALERRGLYRASARGADEMRLLENVLGAVAGAVDPGKLVETVANGIRNVQPGPQWSGVDLALLAEGGREGGAPGPGAELRTYKAPGQPMAAYWNNLREGAMSAGRDLQIAVDFAAGTADGPASQERLLEEGLRRGVQGIAIAPIVPGAVEPWIRRASDAGIPVITFDSPPVAGSRALLYLGTDNVAVGRLAGEVMTRLLPDGGIVEIQVTSSATLNFVQRLEGFRSAVAGSAISLAPPEETHFDGARAIDLAVAALERPGIAGAFGAGSENGLSFGVAAMALGRAGELKIVAVDLVPTTRSMLREGVIHAAVAQREHEVGYRAVQILDDLLTRGAPAVLAELPASRFLDAGIDLVTLERTPWSTALSDYLAQDAARKLTGRTPVRRQARPREVLVVGMAEPRDRTAEGRSTFSPDSLIGRVITSGRSIVVDASAAEHDGWADVAAARRDGVRTLVGVALLAPRGVLGALVLGSERAGACSPGDLAALERIAATAAVAIENAELLQRLSERSRDLERANEEQEALLRTVAELSSPVVPIASGVLVMPLVGALDRERSSRFMASMLQEIADHQARVVLVDVTGMAVVDAAAADLLAQAARAAGLLGAEVVLVGISPGAARLLVEQGLDLGGVVTRSTLELGFAYALAKTGGRMVYGRAEDGTEAARAGRAGALRGR